MDKLETKWLDIRNLEEAASGITVIHRLSPEAKLLTTFAYLLAVTSFSRYEVTALIPFALYPVIMLSLSELPAKLIVGRLLPALPFLAFIGIFNPLFDQRPLLQLGPYLISGGWLSFLSLLLRSVLALAAAVVLIATTGIQAICFALLRLKIPKILVIQILFLHRYLHVLLDEFARTLRAYSLRNFHTGGLKFAVWGSLLGKLLLQTFDRARRIYQAMLCRGFDGQIRVLERARGKRGTDVLFTAAWILFFIAARLINLPEWLGVSLLGR